MHRALYASLFAACFLCIFAHLTVSSHRAFASSARAVVHNNQSSHLFSRKNFLRGFRDGRQAGYDDGLTSCIPKDNGPGFNTLAPSTSASQSQLISSYTRGFETGYESGHRIGKRKCEADQLGDGSDNGDGGDSSGNGDNGGFSGGSGGFSGGSGGFSGDNGDFSGDNGDFSGGTGGSGGFSVSYR